MLLRLKWREGQWPRRPLHSSCSWGQNVQSQLLLVPCCPHCLNSLASPDWDPISKASREGLRPATHQHCLGRQSRMYTTYREAGELPCYITPVSLVQVFRWTGVQPAFSPSSCNPSFGLKLKLFSPTTTPIPHWDPSDLCKELLGLLRPPIAHHHIWIEYYECSFTPFVLPKHHIWLIQKARWFGRFLGVALQSRGRRLCLSNLIWASLIFYSL